MKRDSLTLKGIIESTNTMIAYLDMDYNFVLVNSAYAKGSGHLTEELIGKNHFNLFPYEENRKIFDKVKNTGEPVKFLDKPFVFAHQPERGVTFWDWTLSPVKNEQGKVQGLVLSLMETTEHKKAEDALRESEQRFKLVAEAANVMVYEIDVANGKVKSIGG